MVWRQQVWSSCFQPGFWFVLSFWCVYLFEHTSMYASVDRNLLSYPLLLQPHNHHDKAVFNFIIINPMKKLFRKKCCKMIDDSNGMTSLLLVADDVESQKNWSLMQMGRMMKAKRKIMQRQRILKTQLMKKFEKVVVAILLLSWELSSYIHCTSSIGSLIKSWKVWDHWPILIQSSQLP